MMAAVAARASTRRSRYVALAFCVTWLLLLLAGADHPPPVSFVAILPIVALCGVVVFLRACAYSAWPPANRYGRLFRVLAEGLIGGLMIGILTSLFSWGPASGTPVTLRSMIIWFSVLAGLGALNALVVYALSSVRASAQQ